MKQENDILEAGVVYRNQSVLSIKKTISPKLFKLYHSTLMKLANKFITVNVIVIILLMANNY